MNVFSYAIDQTNGPYVIDVTKPTCWVHSVLVYHGVDQGITVYHDGSQVGTDTSREAATRISGDGEVAIGRRAGLYNTLYASALVDEIKMYNRQLSQKEITNMY